MRSCASFERTLQRELMRHADTVDGDIAARWFYSSSLLRDIIERGQRRGEITDRHDAAFLADMVASTINSFGINVTLDEHYPYSERLQALTGFLRAALG
jgi:hypothetical protein